MQRNLKHVDSGVDSDSLTATTKLTVRIKDAAHLQNLISNLKKVRSVNEVFELFNKDRVSCLSWW